jgi:Trp operon repressor
MDIGNLTLEELKNGYRFDPSTQSYNCIRCEKRFDKGEVYIFDDRLFEASRAIKNHMIFEHGDQLMDLLYGDSKYNTFTDNQKEILKLIYSDLSDKEIAKQLGVSASTIRHQRFMFREKAKQAKMYLAIYEQVLEKKVEVDDAILPVHDSATMVDARYVMTEKEKNTILNAAFESFEPLKLREFLTKEKKKIVILGRIAEVFKKGREYTEKEVNEVLKAIYGDFAILRRYLIEYGFMARTQNCSAYWLK